MKLRLMALWLPVVTCVAWAQQAAPMPQHVGNAAETQAVPGANATDEEVADFFVKCASANANSAFGREVLTGKVGTDQMNAANYYIKLAESYSNSDLVRKEQVQLRNMAGTHAKSCTGGGGQMCALAAMVMVSTAQSQMTTCAEYVKVHKDTLDVRVAPLPATNSTQEEPN